MLQRMQTLALQVACAIVAAPALAQTRTLVNPAANTNLEGGSRISFPFSGKGTMHYQQILGLSGTPTATGLIKQIAWRRDNDTAVSTGDYAAWNPNIDVTLSTSPRTTLTMGKTFANNFGNDATVVFAGTLMWPAQKKQPPGPTPFAYQVPLSKPFLYVPTNGDLLIDIMHRSSDQPNTSALMDADASGGGSTSQMIGTGCPSARNTVVVYSNWGPGSHSRVLLWNATANVPSVFSIGLSTAMWGPFQLPLDLAPLGAPGCKVYQDNVLWVYGQTNASGRWDLTFDMPNIPSLGGQSLHVQFYNLADPGAQNAVNLSVSDAYSIKLATPTPGSPPQSESHTTSLTAAEAGLVQQGYGMITELTY